ncbi:MAG TPA: polysaccharide biosynthesis/export family protein [Vicinamibacterales bacterium]|nr:polysaccharide biosynthesis/export family protein [Vicinamibacterales bacterium]
MKFRIATLALALTIIATLQAQQPMSAAPGQNGNGAKPSAAAAGVATPRDYVIGPDDVLSVIFWREKEMTAEEVVVRPDGKISLALLNDIQAAGLTPDGLRAHIDKAAAKYIADPHASVVVKAINSRKVFITGNVLKPGSYALTTDMTVLQLIAVAGGLLEFADAKNVVVMRKEDGRDRHFKFNYKDVIRQKNVEQNIALRSGDTVIVP